MHQINGGVEEATVIGNSATVMFEGTGPSVDNVITDFEIRIQRDTGRELNDVGSPLMCSTAATDAFPPFTITCSVDNGMVIIFTKISFTTLFLDRVAGHGRVTVSGFDSSGTWAIKVRPPSIPRCVRRVADVFVFDIQL